MKAQLEELRARLREVGDLKAAAMLLGWDQNTYMPPGGAPARARQMALLRRLSHEKATDPALGRLLDDLRSYEESLPYDSDDASLIRIARRDYEQAVKVPSEFVARLEAHQSETYQVWAQARPADDFEMVRPYLEETLALSRQLAEFFPGYEHIADPLIALADYGMTVATLRTVFSALREALLPLIETVTTRPPADDSCLHRYFPESRQLAFGLDVVQRFGYDLDRGRQDKSPHPFTTNFSIDDVRITVRVNEHDLGDAIFSAFHEAGHALYEQGVAHEYEGTPLAGGTSGGIHESQSRLWENLVGRSLPFWRYFYPRLQATFPDALGDVSPETFYRAVNKVQPSLIRTDADEVTYNLHVLIRFDLELQLLEGTLEVRDLPDAWRARYESDLGVIPPDDRGGVLQDVHWYAGIIGGVFQGYTLGNIAGAQFFEAALRAHPEITEEMERGEFGTLLSWLQENIYRHGRKFTAQELLERVTGRPLSIEPYMRYLRGKYGPDGG